MPSIGFWSPFPPQGSGIADYSYSLLADLAPGLDITAVLDDRFNSIVPGRVRRQLRVPDGVKVVNASQLGGRTFDCNVYQMGNNAAFHSYMHDHLLEYPGLLVLHDPSLYDFYFGLCGGDTNPSFLEEVRYDLRTQNAAIPMISVDGKDVVDRLSVPLCRRVVEASVATVVHSDWAAEMITRRCPDAVVKRIYQPAKLLGRQTANSPLTFGILGGINHHKRVLEALSAFAAVHDEFPTARLILAGRIDAVDLVPAISEAIARAGLAPAVDVRFDLRADEFDRTLLECDVLIALRWPTAGETSALVMSAFGAGMPVIASDVPQFREFDARYCWRVPIGGSHEHTSLLRFMRRALEDPDAIRRSGEQAQAFVRREASFALAASQYREAIRDCLERRSRITAMRSRPIAPAVNAIGCWAAATGLGEAARRAVRALSDAGVAVALTEQAIGVPTDPRRVPVDIAALPKGRPAATEICFLNVNELHGVGDDLLRPVNGRYLIAYWYWELADLPEQLVPEARRFDEIWVASRFVQGSLARYTDAPIIIVPSVVAPHTDLTDARRRFGLPPKSCVFLLNFDVSSGVARKNPFAAIDAFASAFSQGERGSAAHLVLKTSHLDRFPEAAFELRRRVDRVNGSIIDEQLSDLEIASLTSSCDVYVSLHRAEGFGLGMAEAMFFGIPAIATRYSGSEEFLTTMNSCGVGYQMKRVTFGDLRFNPGAELLYRPSMLWAEPDVGQAGSWMRLLYENPEVRHRLGDEASRTIRTNYSIEAAGSAMRRRLEEIASARGTDTPRMGGAA